MFVQFVVLMFALMAAASKSLVFEPGDMTTFELQRRAKLGDAKAQLNLKLRLRRRLLLILQRYVEVLALFTIVVLLIANLQFAKAAVFVLIWLLVIESLASLGWFRKLVDRSVRPHLLVLLNIVEPLSFLQNLVDHEADPHKKLFHSKEELLHFIKTDKKVLSEKDKLAIDQALNRQNIAIKDIMTLRSKIITIDMREVIGPLLLDRIHKTGKRHMLVVDKDVDNPVGILTVSPGPLDPQTRQASDMPLGSLYYVNQDLPLDHALGAFLRTSAYMFIVIDTSEEITGVISIEDILQAAVGNVKDPFNQYEDRRVVARLAAPQA